MTKEERVAFSDAERKRIERVAEERGISFEEAVNQLAREGLARRVKQRTGRRPAGQVVWFGK